MILEVNTLEWINDVNDERNGVEPNSNCIFHTCWAKDPDDGGCIKYICGPTRFCGVNLSK